MTPGKRTMGWRLFATEKKDGVSWSFVRGTRHRSGSLANSKESIIAAGFLRGEPAVHKVAWDSPRELRDALSLVPLTRPAQHAPYGYALSF